MGCTESKPRQDRPTRRRTTKSSAAKGHRKIDSSKQLSRNSSSRRSSAKSQTPSSAADTSTQGSSSIGGKASEEGSADSSQDSKEWDFQPLHNHSIPDLPDNTAASDISNLFPPLPTSVDTESESQGSLHQAKGLLSAGTVSGTYEGMSSSRHSESQTSGVSTSLCPSKLFSLRTNGSIVDSQESSAASSSRVSEEVSPHNNPLQPSEQASVSAFVLPTETPPTRRSSIGTGGRSRSASVFSVADAPPGVYGARVSQPSSTSAKLSPAQSVIANFRAKRAEKLFSAHSGGERESAFTLVRPEPRRGSSSSASASSGARRNLEATLSRVRFHGETTHKRSPHVLHRSPSASSMSLSISSRNSLERSAFEFDGPNTVGSSSPQADDESDEKQSEYIQDLQSLSESGNDSGYL